MLKTAFEQIVNVSQIGLREPVLRMNQILRMAMQEDLKPAAKDSLKTLFLIIDPQFDFMPEGELGVPGADRDIERMCRFIYNNMEKITTVLATLDTHDIFQNFHPAWFVDENGEYIGGFDPAVGFPTVSIEDLDNGKWFPTVNPKQTREYLKKMKEFGINHTVWNFHCLQGTTGNAVEDQLAKMLYFHSMARKNTEKRVNVKGTDRDSEMFGAGKPVWSASGKVNVEFYNQLDMYNRIVIAGEAASHCVPATLIHIIEHFQGRPDMLKKIYVLRDCMSCIPGFETPTDKLFKELERDYAINLTTSTEIVL